MRIKLEKIYILLANKLVFIKITNFLCRFNTLSLKKNIMLLTKVRTIHYRWLDPVKTPV